MPKPTERDMLLGRTDHDVDGLSPGDFVAAPQRQCQRCGMDIAWGTLCRFCAQSRREAGGHFSDWDEDDEAQWGDVEDDE